MIAERAGNSGFSWICTGLSALKLQNMFAFPYQRLRLNLSQTELSSVSAAVPPHSLSGLSRLPAGWEPQTQVDSTSKSSPSHHHHRHSHLSLLSPGLWQPFLQQACLFSSCLLQHPPPTQKVSLPSSFGSAFIMLLFKCLASRRVPAPHGPNSEASLLHKEVVIEGVFSPTAGSFLSLLSL